MPNTIMEGLSFIFVELPNFMPESVVERKVTVLWLRFLKEIINNTSMIPEELLEVPEIAEAVEALKISSYSKEELEEYERYWDIVRLQKAYVVDAFKEGKMEEKTDTTINLITNTDFDDTKIAMLVGVEDGWVADIRKKMGK